MGLDPGFGVRPWFHHFVAIRAEIFLMADKAGSVALRYLAMHRDKVFRVACGSDLRVTVQTETLLMALGAELPLSLIHI